MSVRFGLYLCIFMACALASLRFGAADLSAENFLELSLRYLRGETDADTAIFGLRLNRVLASLLIGGSLALCGSVLQKLLRNPLADPHILGLSAGGTTAAVLATVVLIPMGFASGFWIDWLPTLCALAGALMSLGVLLWARRRLPGVEESVTLPLAGLILNAFYGAILMLLVAVASPYELASAQLWMLGTLRTLAPGELGILAACVGVSSAVIFRLAVAIEALAFGNEFAQGLGFAAKRVRLSALLTVAVMVAASVTVSGSVGFVGLIVPHIAGRLEGRRTVGFEWAVSFVLGASVVCVADLLARTVAVPAELPLGIFTALLGAPVLAGLLLRRATSAGAPSGGL